MKTPYITFIVLISVFIAYNLESQNNILKAYTSYSKGEVDKRCDFLYGQYPVGVVEDVKNKINDNTPDDEYAIGLEYNRRLYKGFYVGMNLGYAKLVQDFLLPAHGDSYFKVGIEPFFWRDKSWYHMIQLSPKVQYLILSRKFNVGINLQATGNVSFRKHIKAFNMSRYNLEYFSTEIYPGLTIGYWRFHADIGYRAFHWKYRDNAIANNGLNPDRYNPFKIRFTLSYDILKW